MSELNAVATAFVAVAHRVVWATVATIDRHDRPRSRILHPIWDWDGEVLTGWIATGPTPVKTAHLTHRPYVSVNYWDQHQDVATAECRATWHHDDATRAAVWERFATAEAPVGYDPAIIPGWDAPTDAGFATLRLDPWRLRVFPGSLLLAGTGEVLDWREPSEA